MYRFALLIFPVVLIAFEPRPVTPSPVVGYRTETFFDPAQKMQRDLLIWYPVSPETIGTRSESPWDVFDIALNAPPAASQAKRPVIAISHGYTGSPHQISWLIRALVHYGFIVIGIQHNDLIKGKVHLNHWQRAVDISTIITQFSLGKMASIADLNKIGIAGFSLGGTTAIWIAGGRSTKLKTLIPGPEYASPQDYVFADQALPTLNKEMMSKNWKDARVKAAFIMAPAWSWLFDEESLRKISIPTYLIASSADTVLISKNNAGFFARNIPKAIYQEIPGKGTHFIFVSALNEPQRKKADPSGKLSFLFQDDPSIDRKWIQFEVSQEAVGFFNASL